MKGTIVNSLAIFAGGVLGASAARGLLLRYQDEVNKAIKIAVSIVGIQMALKGENFLITFTSLIVGIIIGQMIDLDGKFNLFGSWMANKVGKLNIGAQNGANFQEGFVTASLIYCVGAIAIIGSIQDGLTGNTDFATTWGIGVALSSISVFIYQGIITLLANQISGFFTPHIINELTAVGGISILAISLKLLNLVDAKIANWIPSIFVAIILASFF